jgi:TM2 domain-containing membrane protein YozV
MIDPMATKQKTPSRPFLTTFWLAAFLGLIGADRFYLGQLRTGVLKLITVGGFGVWTIIDIIYTLSGKRRDVDNKPLKGYKAYHEILLVGLPVGIATFLFPVTYDPNLESTWRTTIHNNHSDLVSLAIAILICTGLVIGWCGFAGFNIVEPIKKKVWIWAAVNFISYMFGLGIIFSAYYYFFVRKQLSAKTLV